MGSGQIIGECDAFYERPNTFSLVSKTADCSVLQLPHELFSKFLKTNEQIKLGKIVEETDIKWANKLSTAIYKLLQLKSKEQSALS